MSYVNIMLALSKHFRDFDPDTILDSGDYSGTYHFVPPGRDLKPEADDLVFETNIIPTLSDNAAIGDGATILEQGLFRISCYYPQGRGASNLVRIAQAVRTHFFPVAHRGLALSEGGDLIRIERPPELSTVMGPDDLYKTHISMDVDVRFFMHLNPS